MIKISVADPDPVGSSLFGAPGSSVHKNTTVIEIFSLDKIVYTVFSSVADPDPDPVGSGLFGSPGSGSGKNTGSGSFNHKKTLVIQIFSLYTIV